MEIDIVWFTVFLATSKCNLVFLSCGWNTSEMQIPFGLQQLCV